jgi:hypothetical protein
MVQLELCQVVQVKVSQICVLFFRHLSNSFLRLAYTIQRSADAEHQHLNLKLIQKEENHLVLAQPRFLEQIVTQSLQHRWSHRQTPSTSICRSFSGVEVVEVGDRSDRTLAAASHCDHLSRCRSRLTQVTEA